MIIVDISSLDYEPGIQLLKSHTQWKNDIKLHIDFWADHSQSKIIRDYVGFLFDNFWIANPWKGRFILITDELINNAIEHGSAPGDLDSCVIEAWENDIWDFCIVIEVHDTGNWKDSKDATHMNEIKEAKLEKGSEWNIYMEKRGRGLFYITEKIVDRLSFSESPIGGLAVKIEKNIKAILEEK